MSRLIVITSGKGGVGKTTTSINLAASLNSFGKNVVIADVNLTTPNVGLHLGAPVVPITLNNVLQGKNKLSEAIYEHHSGTKIVPASLALSQLKDMKLENFSKVMKQLKKHGEFVICDSPAGLGREVSLTFQLADELIVVTNPELPAVTDALKAIKLAEDLGKSITGIIVTRVKNDKNELSLKDIQVMLERPIIGIVPEDISVKEALLQKDAVVHTHPKSDAAIAYKKIAAKLIGRRYVPPEDISFFSKVLSAIGLKK